MHRVTVGVYSGKAQILLWLRHDREPSVRSLDKQKYVTLWILCLKHATNLNRFKHLQYKQDYEIWWNISWNDCTCREDTNSPTVKKYIYIYILHTSMSLVIICWTHTSVTAGTAFILYYPYSRSADLFHLPTLMHNSLFINNMHITLHSSTCFEHQHAHLQEDKLYYHSIWYRNSL